MTTNKTYPVVGQRWEESERGWGTRPDGYTLHLTDADRKAFVDKYWRDQPREVPDEYSRPCGSPFVLDVNQATYNEIKKTKHGQWYSGQPNERKAS